MTGMPGRRRGYVYRRLFPASLSLSWCIRAEGETVSADGDSGRGRLMDWREVRNLLKNLLEKLKKLKKTLAFQKICAIINLACEGNKETNKTSREN